MYLWTPQQGKTPEKQALKKPPHKGAAFFCVLIGHGE
jgi:hypothetical protein